MNKRIKRIVACAVVMGTITSVAPLEGFNFMSVKAYASDRTYELKDLTVKKTDGSSEIKLYEDDDYDNSTDYDDGTDDYYAKTDQGTVVIKAPAEDGTTRIFKSKSSSKAYKSGEEFTLSKGDNDFYIRVYDSFDPDEVDDYEKEYELHIEKKGAADVYLKSISLNEGNIDFSRSTNSYDVEVASGVSQIRITAKPSDEDDEVRIDGYTVDDSNDYRKTVELSSGKNTIEVEVEDDDDSSETRTYTLNVYRGTKAPNSTTTTNTTTTTDTTAVKDGVVDNTQPAIYLEDIKLNDGDTKINFKKDVSVYNVKVASDDDEIKVKASPDYSEYDVEVAGEYVDDDDDYEVTVENLKTGKNVVQIQVKKDDGKKRIYTLNIYKGVEIPVPVELKKNTWIGVAGRYQYNGSDGLLVKNNIIYDAKWANHYYLDSNGYMASNTWVQFNNNYYFADGSGALITGWRQTSPGKWYYFDPSTKVMVTNTYIGSYRIGSDGLWIQ